MLVGSILKFISSSHHDHLISLRRPLSSYIIVHYFKPKILTAPEPDIVRGSGTGTGADIDLHNDFWLVGFAGISASNLPLETTAYSIDDNAADDILGVQCSREE